MHLTLLHSERPKLYNFGLSECKRVKVWRQNCIKLAFLVAIGLKDGDGMTISKDTDEDETGSALSAQTYMSQY